MNKFQIGIIGAAVIIIAELILIDYDKLFGSKNIVNYITMIAMVLVIIGQVNAKKKS